MKKLFWISAAILLAILVYTGCGRLTSSSSSTNYTIQGTVSVLSSSGIGALAASTVTHIVAIGSDGQKHLADLSSNGTFSIGVNKGVPYALGFYNKTGSTITLLGYLQQKDVSWESLPLMNPTGESTNLGTVTIDSSSIEAIPSIDLTSLISQMNMVDLTTASYYGELDGPMAVFTNIDVDGNGEFDFQEGKSYIFQTFINVANGTNEISQMLNGNYNESYLPVPQSYTVVIAAQGDTQAVSAPVVFHFPAPVGTDSGASSETVTSTIEATSDSGIWTCFSKINGNPIFTPEVTPAGTYTINAGSKTYTFSNYKASEIVKVNSNNGIIYPVFNLATNESGYITTVNYKWKKLTNGSIGNATAAEVKAALEDTSANTTFVHTSPFISFFSDSQTLIGNIIKFNRDGSSVDVSSSNVKLSNIHHIQASYNLTSRVVCKFDLY